MSQDQRYEYTTEKVAWHDFEEKAEDMMNKMAEDGWKLIDTALLDGATTYYIFERPVE